MFVMRLPAADSDNQLFSLFQIHSPTHETSINFHTRLLMPLIFSQSFCYSVCRLFKITDTCRGVLSKIALVLQPAPFCATVADMAALGGKTQYT